MNGALAGKRILLIEDEYFIASDLKRALRDEGAVPIGPVGDVAAGLALIEREPLDAALLDVNLEGESSFPIADRLAENDVPHLFLTGYDGWSLPDAYRDAPRIAKPFAVDRVIGALAQLVRPEQPA